MPNAVFYCSFKLKKGACVSDFLQAAEKLNNEHISKQHGYISWQQMSDGDTWADFIAFETMEDVKKFEAESADAGELAQNFYSFINLNSCIVRRYSIKQTH